jgi:hypothetical protein
MSRYRKKPVVIDAIRWMGGPYEGLNDFCGLDWGRADARDVCWTGDHDGEYVVVWNKAEKQWLQCSKGHWIIRGVQGEYYPCKPDIFAMTYEPAETTETA